MLNKIDFGGINFQALNKFGVNGAVSGLVPENLQGGGIKLGVVGYGKYLLFTQSHYSAKIVIR